MATAKGKKPRKPVEPLPPPLHVKRREEVVLDDVVTLEALLAAAPENVPDSEVTVEACGEYDDNNGIYLIWHVDVPNPNYKRDYAKYLERLKTYEIAHREYEKDIGAYEAEEHRQINLTNARIAELEAEIEALRKSVSPRAGSAS